MAQRADISSEVVQNDVEVAAPARWAWRSDHRAGRSDTTSSSGWTGWTGCGPACGEAGRPKPPRQRARAAPRSAAWALGKMGPHTGLPMLCYDFWRRKGLGWPWPARSAGCVCQGPPPIWPPASSGARRGRLPGPRDARTPKGPPRFRRSGCLDLKGTHTAIASSFFAPRLDTPRFRVRHNGVAT